MEHLPVKELDELQDIVPTGEELTLLWHTELGVGKLSLLNVRAATATYIDKVTSTVEVINPDDTPRVEVEETQGDATGRHREYVFHHYLPSGVAIDDVSIGTVASLSAGSAPTAAIRDVSIDDNTTGVDESKTHKRYKLDIGIQVPKASEILPPAILSPLDVPTVTDEGDSNTVSLRFGLPAGVVPQFTAEVDNTTGTPSIFVVRDGGTDERPIYKIQVSGIKGEPGMAFTIAKLYPSIADMTADYDSTDVLVGQFCMIDTGNIEDEDNAKLFIKGRESWELITDLSGATGLRGPQGEKGERGQDGTVTFDMLTQAQKDSLKGDSAYQIWLDAGNTGTIDDFIAALKGEKVDKGEQGDNAYQVWLKYGNEGTEADFLSALQGADGKSCPLDGLMSDAELRQAGADLGTVYLSDASKVYHLDDDLTEARGGGALETSGALSFDEAGAIPPNARNTLASSAKGAFRAKIPLGSAKVFCADLFIKVISAPADCVLLEVGSKYERVRLLRRGNGLYMAA